MKINDTELARLKNKWVEIGMSTEPVDMDKVIPIINRIYQSKNFSVPEFFFFAPSPLEGIKMAHVLPIIGYDNLKASPNPQALVNEKIGDFDDSKFTNTGNICYGNHEAATLSFYDYFINNEMVDGLEEIIPYIELAEVCGWWIPLRAAVVVVNRPSVIKMDERNLAHCQDGPAIAYYNSNFAVYMWHGVRIPAQWMKDKNYLTPEIALTHPNVEQRRAACEILGWDTILSTLDAKIIDTDDDPYIGQLLEVELPELGTERFLKVKCGTGRTFALPVPPTINTALEANSWTYGVAANEYIPEIRT